MRVLHLTRDYPPRHCGGISTAVGGLVPALARGGIECAVASFDGYGSSRASGGSSRTEPCIADPAEKRLLRIHDPEGLSRLPRFAEDFGPDVIQLHVDLLWDTAAELRERLGAPVVTTLHVCHRQMLRVLGAERRSASLEAQERALAASDRLVAPTRAAADAIVRDYPRTSGRLRVAGFTVDTAPAQRLEEPRLVTLGRFGAAKGTDRLVALLPHLLADPRLTVDVIGGLPRNPQRDRRWRRRIAEAAGEHGERVRMHGWLGPEDRDAVLCEARSLLSVSRVETFGLAALEAMALGIPVCGYREPALVETAPGQAWLADGDPAAVAGEVVDLLGDRARCLALGRSGRRAIRPWSAVVEAWRAVFET